MSDNKNEQIETHEGLTKKYPNLTLSYGQVKDVLTEQEETAERLDNKIATLFAAATAVFGISIPFFFALLPMPFSKGDDACKKDSQSYVTSHYLHFLALIST